MRRVVELADGWAPMPSPARASPRLHTPGIETLDDLAQRIGELQAMARDAGRTDALDIVFMPSGLDMFGDGAVDAASVVESVRALAAVGVTYAAASIPGRTRAQVVANFATFRDEILPEVAGVSATNVP
jgi:hypothetical protein